MDGERKRISCRRCQLRKLKCTRIYPCNNCVTSSTECVFRDDDVRRRPVSRAYVAALEERLASYEANVPPVPQPRPTQRSLWLQGRFLPDAKTDTSEGASPDLIFDYSGSSRMSTLILQPSPQGHRSFYGPTSIYQKTSITDDVKDGNEDQSNFLLDEYTDVRLSGILKVDDIIFNEGLSMFFRHLYAECPFIDGTILLSDFLHDKHHAKFWSYPLLYAICCLGAKISREARISKASESLGRCVHDMLSMKNLKSPHVTLVQALTCLAFLELGAGNNTKGWMLSGMAFRMIQDLGLHQDPKFLTKDDSSIDLAQDSQMRRKVYWGSYVSDKVISLYFGRPLYLNEDDASVDPLDLNKENIIEEAPKMPECHSSTTSLLTELTPLPILPQLVNLSKIIELMMSEVFSTKLIKLPRQKLVIHRVAKLEELNIQLFRWHSTLPECFAWNQWTPTTQSLSPQLATMHALYHSCIISLNRHFIRPTPGFARKSQSREVCMASADSIMAITRQYRAQHSLSTAPLTIVYSLGMAATAITFALDVTTLTQGQSSEFAQHFNFLLKTLGECSKTHAAAIQIAEKLRSAMTKLKQFPTGKNETSTSEPGTQQVVTSSTEAFINLQNSIDVGPELSSPMWWGNESFNPGEIGTWPDELGDLSFLQDADNDIISSFNWSNTFM